MRLDVFLVQQKFFGSRSQANAAIREGKVIVNGRTVTKAGYEVNEISKIEVSKPPVSYVSRGGYKLQGAIEHFEIDLRGKTVLDIGASTGGFTDCCLKNGAERVYAFDVGSNQLDKSLLNDERVISRENVNCRYLKREDIPEGIDFICMDVSFISATKMLEAISDILDEGKKAVILFKPQFEVGPENLNSRGIVNNQQAVSERLEDCKRIAKSLKLELTGMIDSPIKGGDGNQEFLLCFVKKEQGEGV